MDRKLKLFPLEEEKARKLLELKNSDFFLTADHHFFHERVLDYEPSRKRYLYEGFPSMEDWLLERWNRTVGKDDFVLHLGDFSFKEGDLELLELLAASLNGKIFLILGNHDTKPFEVYGKLFYLPVERGFVYAELGGEFFKIPTGLDKATGLILETPKGRILFSHYPIAAEERFFFDHVRVLNEIFYKTECVLNVHGHTHSVDLDDPRCVNVSVEKTDFKPVRLSEILEAGLNQFNF